MQRTTSFHSDGGVGSNPVLAAGNVSLEAPAFCVWGANTGVGKTLVSAGLAASARRHFAPMFYLKPVQTAGAPVTFLATGASPPSSLCRSMKSLTRRRQSPPPPVSATPPPSVMRAAGLTKALG
jgi:hypothetical protein